VLYVAIFSRIRIAAGLALISACLRGQEWRSTVQPSDFDQPVFRRAVHAMLMPSTAFAPVQPFSKELAEVWQASKGALSFFLMTEVDPYRGVDGVHWRARPAEHGGSDLLRSEYTSRGLRFTLTESINFVTLHVEGRQSFKDVSDKNTFLAGLIVSVVRLSTQDHQWHFELPRDLDSTWNKRVIPNRGAPPLRDIQTRDDRADIVILNDSVYFVFYPKIAQLDGWPAEDRWFGPQAREALSQLIR
jgi:hypothetical protein